MKLQILLFILVGVLSCKNSFDENNIKISKFNELLDATEKVEIYSSINRKYSLFLYKYDNAYYTEKVVGGNIIIDTGLYFIKNKLIHFESIIHTNKNPVELKKKQFTNYFFDSIMVMSEGKIHEAANNNMQFNNSLFRVGTIQNIDKYLVNGSGNLMILSSDLKTPIEYGYYNDNKLKSGIKVGRHFLFSSNTNASKIIEIDYKMTGCFTSARDKMLVTSKDNEICVEAIIEDSIYMINYHSNKFKKELFFLCNKILAKSSSKKYICTTRQYFKINFQGINYEYEDRSCENFRFDELFFTLFNDEIFQNNLMNNNQNGKSATKKVVVE